MSTAGLPYFLEDFAGVGGVIKLRPEDFFVQEIPLYDPSGDGDHVMVEYQKVGISTFDANDYIARALNVSRRDIGYAGLKDAKAVTRQFITIPFVKVDDVMNITSDRITILRADKHRNKLRMGHLAGNRFAIRIREVDPMKVVTLRPAIDILVKRGIPNYFGEQRFGRRNNNDLLGAAFVRGDDKDVLRMLLGDPRPNQDQPEEFQARTLFAGGKYEDALKSWPFWAHNEKRALSRYARTSDAYEAVMAVDMQIRRMWVTALQSRMFNEIVTQRIKGIDKLIPGDLALKYDSGACYHVENLAVDQPRADAFEVSPTGPMIGRRLSLPRGPVRDMELALFRKYDVSSDDFRSNSRDRSHGDRRPLRAQLKDVQLESGVDDHGGYITVAFTLPPGAYATVLMRELMKNDSQPQSPAETDQAEQNEESEQNDD